MKLQKSDTPLAILIIAWLVMLIALCSKARAATLYLSNSESQPVVWQVQRWIHDPRGSGEAAGLGPIYAAAPANSTITLTLGDYMPKGTAVPYSTPLDEDCGMDYFVRANYGSGWVGGDYFSTWAGSGGYGAGYRKGAVGTMNFLSPWVAENDMSTSGSPQLAGASVSSSGSSMTEFPDANPYDIFKMGVGLQAMFEVAGLTIRLMRSMRASATVDVGG